MLEAFLPLYNDSAVEMARLSKDRAQDGAWRWEHRDGRLLLHATEDGRGEELHLSSVVPSFWLGLAGWGRLLSGVVVLGLAMVGVVWFIVRRLLLLRTHVPLWMDRAGAGGPLGGHVVRISRRRDRLALPVEPGSAVLDLAAAEAAVLAGTALAEARIDGRFSAVVVDRFEHRAGDPAFDRARLALVEALLRDPVRRLVLLSALDPHVFLVAGGEPALRERWREVLADFQGFDLDAAGAPEFLAERLGLLAARELDERPPASRLGRAAWQRHVERCVETIGRECGPTARLQTIGLALLPRLALAEVDPGQLRDEIADCAEPYYETLWASLATAEKLVLVQVAEEGLVNPKSRRPLLRLLGRGLLVREPELRLLNETFRRFVVGKREDVLPVERENARDSAWSQLKRPLAAVLLGIAVFVFATQRDVFNTTLVFVSAVAGALPQLLKVADYFRGGRRGAAAPAS